jgi:hypothetical protein
MNLNGGPTTSFMRRNWGKGDESSTLKEVMIKKIKMLGGAEFGHAPLDMDQNSDKFHYYK